MKVNVRRMLGLASAAALFLLGCSVGYLAKDKDQITSLSFSYSQYVKRSSSNKVDISNSSKEVRHPRNGDETEISMHTVFMSGCDKWQVTCDIHRFIPRISSASRLQSAAPEFSVITINKT